MLLVRSTDWNNQIASYGVTIFHRNFGKMVVLTELSFNQGMSITQAGELYLHNIKKLGLWHPDEISTLCFIEHLPGNRYTQEHFQKIIPKFSSDSRVTSISWEPLEKEIQDSISATLRGHTPIPLRDANNQTAIAAGVSFGERQALAL